MAPKKGGLGRGLESLFNENATDTDGAVRLNINDIEPNRGQPRKDFDETALSELADSIAQVQPEASYTAGSWEAYQAKLAEVRALLNDENLTEEAADAALAELQAAVAELAEPKRSCGSGGCCGQ